MRFWLCVLGLPVLWSGFRLSAQDASTPQDSAIHTLHVYTNLIQIPTLVLGPHRERIQTPIAESRFFINIDDGPWFRATHVRQEGDDPISLAILLDLSDDTAELMSKVSDAIAGLAPLSLHPTDHVSIYALDCALIRSWNNAPVGAAGLRAAVDSALQSWTTRMHKKHERTCKQTVHLWDSLAYVIGAGNRALGRQVILVVSDGKDKGSGHSWNEVRVYAQAGGVAIFGMSDIPSFATGMARMFSRFENENPFQSLCELTGGMVLFTSSQSFEETLKMFTSMLRERYIVEFPRPSNSTAGRHEMQVKIAKGGGDFIRSTGIAVPIPDPAVLADPTTVPADPSHAPEQGSRRIITKPQ